jgi:D-beta-D-heptose 7-phosphate kinase/D-beta-D-heptose 1-phosphate adenosyltransferase
MTLESRLAGSHTVVVGDLILDEQVWGRVRRISPEAPVPVVDVQGRNHLPGGAANVAAGVVALGGRVTLVGVLGDDASATLMRAALVERGIDAACVLTVPGRRTTTKTRVIAQSQHVVRLDTDERTLLSSELERHVLGYAEREIPSADVVVLSDYGKGVITPVVAATLIASARRIGKPVVVDPAGNDYSRYRGATVLTPNVQEAKGAAHFGLDEFVDLADVARRLAAVVPDSALLITRGAEGMTLLTAEGAVDVQARTHDIYDVTGAGDTVVATLAAALGGGWTLEDAVRLANTAAGIAVSKVGTATVSIDELVAEFGA